MNKEPVPELKNITSHFQIPGEFIRAERYGHGHINDTYLAESIQPNGTADQFIIQRINHFVFKNPEAVTTNIAAVTSHLREKILIAGGDPDRKTLSLIPTHEDYFLHISADGTYWRAYVHIQNATTYQTPASQAHVYHAGRAFGKFQRMLADFPVGTLYKTIPDFHNTPVRYKTFLAAVEADKRQRVAGAAAEIAFVRQRAAEVSIIMDVIKHGGIPLRVTHNDTKFNNVLIDNHTGEGICIIDLDTVMPGSLLFDYGDAIRSITNTAAEDEPDLNRVHFDLITFGNFTKGYLEALGSSITPEEYALLPFSARLMTLECGMRFLTDHLEGDEYFRISREGHNLDRCRTQFKLVQEMESQFSTMKQIVSQHAAPATLPPDGFIGGLVPDATI